MRHEFMLNNLEIVQIILEDSLYIPAILLNYKYSLPISALMHR